jgi:magnesium chelatase family protein
MALGRSLAVAVVGMEGHLVEVEADIALGLPAFALVGLPDASLAESRDRVRAATANSGHALPQRRITVNLSPAGLPKAGTGFDLAVAVALLSAAGITSGPSTRRFVHVGELGLDGRVRPVRGVLPAALAAVREGRPDVVVPLGNAREAELVPGARVRAVGHLQDVIALHGGESAGPPPSDLDAEPVAAGLGPHAGPEFAGGVSRTARSSLERSADVPPDLADVVGQPEARLALEVAAAGGHHLLLVGPPGAGKTLLASRLPGVLPDLDDGAAVEVTSIHSVAGTLDPAAGLIRRPPFENPHHTSTMVSLVGGGSGLPRPGAASRAHRGVLLLDEAAEFDARVLDSLRQPLENGELVIHRAQGAARFPARFQLVLATNPCPCGLANGTGLDCTCTPSLRRRYMARLSGPLLDRVDLQVEVMAVSRADLVDGRPPEDTATVAARVATARALQRERLAGTPWVCNGEVSGGWLRGEMRLPPSVTDDLDVALDRARLSIRGYDRVLRVAWTISDLAGRDRPGRDDVGRALTLRQRGQAAA